jgi:hypothetical protein
MDVHKPFNGFLILALLLPTLLTGGLALRPSHDPGDGPNNGVSAFSALSGSVVQIPTASETSGWAIERVDTPGACSWMTDRSLRLDAAGYPHIACGADRLYHAWYDGGTWHVETADDTAGVGEHASLALDASGYAHVSYYDGTSGNLMYAYQDGSGWHTRAVDTGGDVGLYTSLAVDGSGYPHVSYYDETGGDLMYAYRDGSGWHTRAVDSGDTVGEYTSLALDESGHPHISYRDWDDDELKVAYRDGSGWHLQIADTGLGYFGGHTSLALDGEGYPHISYFDGANYDLEYAYRDGSGWHTETLDSAGHVGWYTSLALDESGHPHVSYFDGTNYDLKIAHLDGSGWHTETLDSAEDVGRYTSLALDRYGYPHISYYDATNGCLKYAVALLPAPTLHPISNPDGDGDYTATWSSVMGADAYTLQEDDHAGFTSPATRYTGNDAQFAVSGRSPGTWYYRVKASGAVKDGEWSNTESVTVKPDPPTLYAIDNPDGDGDYTVDWSNVTGADAYTLQEDDSANFNSPVTRYAGGASQVAVTGQDAGTWHYRVSASNAAGESGWSSVESVTVKPGAPTLYPIDNPDEDGSYLVDWSDVTGADAYTLEEDDPGRGRQRGLLQPHHALHRQRLTMRGHRPGRGHVVLPGQGIQRRRPQRLERDPIGDGHRPGLSPCRAAPLAAAARGAPAARHLEPGRGRRLQGLLERGRAGHVLRASGGGQSRDARGGRLRHGLRGCRHVL